MQGRGNEASDATGRWRVAVGGLTHWLGRAWQRVTRRRHRAANDFSDTRATWHAMGPRRR